MRHKPSRNEIAARIAQLRRQDKMVSIGIFVTITPLLWYLMACQSENETVIWGALGTYALVFMLVVVFVFRFECPKCRLPLSTNGRFTIGTLNYSNCPGCGASFDQPAKAKRLSERREARSRLKP